MDILEKLIYKIIIFKIAKYNLRQESTMVRGWILLASKEKEKLTWNKKVNDCGVGSKEWNSLSYKRQPKYLRTPISIIFCHVI